MFYFFNVEKDYYNKAREWYNSIYVNPASERLVYFVILFLSLICLFKVSFLIKTIYDSKHIKRTYVLIMNHKDNDSYIKINHTSFSGNKFLGFLELIINRYVTNRESLMFDDNKSGTDAIKDKSIIIKNLSNHDVYNNYINNSCCNEDSDMSLGILKIQKIAKVDNIEFLYEKINIFEKIYSHIALNRIPKGAKVYFSTETTDEKSKTQHMVATIYFSFSFSKNSEGNEIIDFKVNDYYTEKDVDFTKSY